MAAIKQLLANLEVLSNNTHVASQDISAVIFDSRKAVAGTIFVAIKGTISDGHSYIQVAISQGCTEIVCEVLPVDLPLSDKLKANFYVVLNSNKALGILAKNFYNNPSSKLKLVGITGTNGKTTTATLLHALFQGLGYQTGLLSTVVNKIGNTDIPATHTTPEPVQLNALLNEMVLCGCTHCFMEVSSHAVHQGRIEGLEFDGGVFTNITHDHLDYHKTFAAYIKAKKGFFDSLSKSAFSLVNLDDKNGLVMTQNTKSKVVTYSLKSASDYKLKILENTFNGLIVQFDGLEVYTNLIGDFNGYNLLAVYATAIELGEERMEILTEISQLAPVTGRFEQFETAGKITIIVDYAHTPDALENVLKTIKNIRTFNETVYTIVGCGGDRDKTKRPIMAKIATELSDKVILTSDNPRTENAQTILAEMEVGVPGEHFKKTLSILDRKEAIKTAIAMAQSNDIILIAGKGHENYQEINGVKHPFDDLEIAKELTQKLGK